MSGDYRTSEGGFDTTRVSASEQDRLAREKRQATALHFLNGRGLGDVAVILGLTPELCAGGCGAEAVRAGYCDSRECRTQRRRDALASRLLPIDERPSP